MLITTTEVQLLRNDVQVLGMVRGNIVLSRHIGKDFMAGMRGIVGGEVKQYTEMSNEARDVAVDRMVQEAARLGADEIVGVRFAAEPVREDMVEILAYGTAIKNQI